MVESCVKLSESGGRALRKSLSPNLGKSAFRKSFAKFPICMIVGISVELDKGDGWTEITALAIPIGNSKTSAELSWANDSFAIKFNRLAPELPLHFDFSGAENKYIIKIKLMKVKAELARSNYIKNEYYPNTYIVQNQCFGNLLHFRFEPWLNLVSSWVEAVEGRCLNRHTASVVLVLVHHHHQYPSREYVQKLLPMQPGFDCYFFDSRIMHRHYYLNRLSLKLNKYTQETIKM